MTKWADRAMSCPLHTNVPLFNPFMLLDIPITRVVNFTGKKSYYAGFMEMNETLQNPISLSATRGTDMAPAQKIKTLPSL